MISADGASPSGVRVARVDEVDLHLPTLDSRGDRLAVRLGRGGHRLAGEGSHRR
ncbi:hypothetical protein ABZU25_06870 [Micromonospora sp. NPDC005215]|uniref:hypothetical protein n=1 Tax=Micromonospora sp. NPDC005215 TaxID=3157024 RepID=UPI00339F340E